MPHKHNAKRQHHIAKARYTITNCSEYETRLKQQGSLTLWIAPEAIQLWAATACTTPGGYKHYPHC